MNVVFISPNFPESFRLFCVRLRENGVNVLGIGDAHYEELHYELKNALTEYYHVDSLEDYDSVLRAMGYLTGRHGKIDWVESNNEYWLEQDAALRTDFNITTGLKSHEMARFKRKSVMKEYYRSAGLTVARGLLVTKETKDEEIRDFAALVGYPIVAKPDNGVGAIATYKITCDADLEAFIAEELAAEYLMEEYVPGEVTTFDGVCDADGNVLLGISHVTPTSIMDMVNEQKPCWYYVCKEVPEDIETAGKAVLKAFGVKSRCFHLEFFRLTEAKKGLGEVGDIVALEVNMRPAGGYTVDMINFSQSTDIFAVWADMVAFNEVRHTFDGPHSYCVFAGRRDADNYKRTHDEVKAYAGEHGRLFTYMNNAMSTTMGNEVCIATYDTMEEVQDFVKVAFELA